jgi:hypothetical protein
MRMHPRFNAVCKIHAKQMIINLLKYQQVTLIQKMELIGGG